MSRRKRYPIEFKKYTFYCNGCKKEFEIINEGYIGWNYYIGHGGYTETIYLQDVRCLNCGNKNDRVNIIN